MKLNSLITLFSGLMIMAMMTISCKDDKDQAILSSLQVFLHMDDNYDFISITNTMVKISNLKTGEVQSMTLQSGNNLYFEDLTPGEYNIYAHRQLTNEETTEFVGNPEDEIYISATRKIKAGEIKDIQISLILKPNIEFVPAGTASINEFIYTYMDYAYFWNTDMPDIDYRLEQDSESYFYKLLKSPDDRWSFITDDIAALENYFQGISKSKGYSIQPYYFQSGSNQVVIFVEYVYRNSPAEDAGLKRGDMFYKINGNVITDANYQQLLNLDNITITLGQINNGVIIPLEPEIEISAVENFQAHPVIATNILEVDNKKVGYLAYSSFRNNYDTALVNTFSNFKAAGVEELVLDLRYNGGGYVSSALLLASMMAPANTVGETFIREVWNDNLKQYNESLTFQQETANLDLNRVYILTTRGTASASEMIIYGLAPYMDVVQVGAQTHGKYYGSVTISDNTDPEKRRHNWAIQPIVMRSENVDNSINYQQGLLPDYELDDVVYNALLGDEEEYFLANTLSLITSGTLMETTSLKAASERLSIIDGFREFYDPLRRTMVTDFPNHLEFKAE